MTTGGEATASSGKEDTAVEPLVPVDLTQLLLLHTLMELVGVT